MNQRCCLVLLVLVGVLLVACTPAPAAPVPTPQSGGSSTPEAVAEGFFEDLGRALQDQNLRNPSVRDAWVERLASYFAPDERAAQRSTIRANLDQFARDLRQLAPDERLTLEIRFDPPRKLSDDGSRAVVELPNATLQLLIVQLTERGQVITYDQSVSLSELIGRSSNSVPAIKVGDRWFLTEE